MKFSPTDVTNLLGILQLGRQHAQTATQIEAVLYQKFNFPISGNQHIIRALIKHAIQHGKIIKSSTANPPGFWISNDKQEIIKNIESLKKRARKTQDSSDNLKATWNSTYPTDPIA